ncbi:MAG: phosphate regulon sensor histidine kinase PhoR [Methylophaga sp.]|nr:MAG: phosphate regulon sensor histidine kinase PhoR [Methylophaga sp.]
MSWDYWRLLTVVSLTGFVGLLFDQMILFMFIASLLYALWLQRAWNQLWSWLQNPKKNQPPTAEGMIDDICRQIESVRLQNKSRKKKLADYLKQFQAATAALPDAVVVLGSQGQVAWANTAAKELLGISWPRDSHVRVHNLIRDPVFQKLLTAPITKKKAKIVISPVNSDSYLEMKIVSYMGNGRLLIARDMSQTVKLQKMRRDFVANVSHELRTPLTVLYGYLELFDQDSPADMWRSALPVMRQQTQRMNLMLSDLLVLSQLETGEKKLQHEPVDISVLLATIAEDAKQIKEYKQHQIKLELDSDDWLLADPGELRSAISNLVFNAVKYTSEQSIIVLRWTVANNGAYIEVRDNGMGIAEHHLERLTERFYRVDSGRSQESGGTGLGLAIVKHILKRHDAKLNISSEIGVGSQFHCFFPVAKVIKKSKALK